MIQNDAHDYTINRIGGTGKGSKNGQGFYEESSTPKFAIGAKLELGDNRVFRYSYASAAITVGKVVSTDSAQLIVADAPRVDTDILCQPVLRDAHWLEEFLEQDLSRVYWRKFSFNHLVSCQP